ncbi:MAG: FGGY family carbohydrate kinase [Lachnospiraceae bacterium]|nr:FGGY family carbohydrate kinase [Lachnospiraceae bacterium]
MDYILGIDIGTTAIKAAMIGADGKIYGSQTSEYPLSTLPTGEVEAELKLYEDAFAASVKGVIQKSGVDVKEIKCIGFSSTAETCVFLDEENRPLCKVIAWMDTRATKEAEYLSAHFSREDAISKIGFDGIYAIHPVSKILAVKNKTPEIFEKTRMFAQIKDYFIFKLTGKYYTDHSTASDHGFFDITNRCYWKEMLDFVGMKEEYLPELTAPGTELGVITKEAAKFYGLDPDTKINVGAFDQGCGAVGAGNIKAGIASESTGSALVTVATIDQMNEESDGSVPTLCSGIPGKYMYQPYCTGSIIVKWFRDVFCQVEKDVEAKGGANAYTQMDSLVMATPAGADGLIMLPYFQGSGIPELNENANGVYYGIHAGHERGHFIRAIMEGIAIALKRMLECEAKLGATATEIRSLGGGSKSKAWCQIKADILGIPVKVVENSESTPCMGCAILAGVANGIWPSVEYAADKFVAIKETYLPNPENAEVYESLYKKYVEITKALDPTFR